jgi:hypothetical protein
MSCNVELHNVDVGEFEFWPVVAYLDPLCSATDGHKAKVPWIRFNRKAVRFVSTDTQRLYLKTDRGTQLTT